MRILISEDDLTARLMLTSVLEKQGHQVTVTTNGTEAWAAMQRADAPSLAILDWVMPGLDGLEVVRRVRGRELPNQGAYLIMLTHRGNKADVIAGLQQGANDYLAKPFDPGELHARVEVGRRMLEIQAQLNTQVQELRQALEHIKTLQGILPLCMHCKQIRDDQGYWKKVEVYLSQHSDLQFSHSVCPDCMVKFYPEFLDRHHEEPATPAGPA
jgi:phosphoserine phosphatase RsbU/P